ncbi:hypothetical protein L083_5504 [Actinoplanes sp. N902-109]|nr:hypothetical protein L083_5504 [Actinoplanes sp. N902-109]
MTGQGVTHPGVALPGEGAGVDCAGARIDAQTCSARWISSSAHRFRAMAS